jgi:TfoX/Sxy family transcriptional regulator of competence genes
MAYDEQLATRIRERLAEIENVEEKPMMGGLTFMINGKMCVGIIKNDLMCRIDPAEHAGAVERTGCRTMDFTAKPMKGYILIDETGMRDPQDFNFWIGLALSFNPKAKASGKRK